MPGVIGRSRYFNRNNDDWGTTVTYKPKPERDFTCALCGTVGLTTMANKRFCSEEHRLEFRRMINELGRCPHCMKELLKA